MKLLILIIFTLGIVFAISNNLKCPEDDATLRWIDTKYCEGAKCRTVEYYKCYRCNNVYKLYID